MLHNVREVVMRINEGMPVDASDGPCGEVVDIVVDPVRRTLTHLVVRPVELRARLVPMEAVAAVADRVRLSWTHAQLLEADEVEEAGFLALHEWPHLQGGWDVGVVRVLAWPYYVSGEAVGSGAGADAEEQRTTTEYDRIPAGTAEIRRQSAVVSSDGEAVGRVDGLVVDAALGITHLVLEHGHLWGHREVTIPVAAIAQVETDAVHLSLTRDQVADLPSVRFHRHAG